MTDVVWQEESDKEEDYERRRPAAEGSDSEPERDLVKQRREKKKRKP